MRLPYASPKSERQRCGAAAGAIVATLTGSDTASAEGISITGASPVLALCRKLIVYGFDPGGFAERPNPKGKRVAAIGDQRQSRIIPGSEKPAAQRQNRRRAGDADAFGGSSVAAGERGDDCTDCRAAALPFRFG